MGDNHRSGINQRIARQFRLDLFIFADPFGRNVECGVDGIDARNVIRIPSRRQRQIVIHQDIPSGHLLALQQDAVLVGIELPAVLNPDRRDYEAHIQSHLLTEHDDTVDEVAAVALIRQRYQAVSEFHLNLFHGQKTVYIFNIFIEGSFTGHFRFHISFRRLSHDGLLPFQKHVSASDHHC